MKKSHLILLIVTLIITVFSAYSLAEINQIYKIAFECFTYDYNRYLAADNYKMSDKWWENQYPKEINFSIVRNQRELESISLDIELKKKAKRTDFEKDMLLYCSLGFLNSYDYRIKVMDIAQRENTVEVRVSTNSPEKLQTEKKHFGSYYLPVDLVKIKRESFVKKGKLLFIFKDQTGKQIFRKHYEIEN
ncbi:MAG: hypothetical protein N2645_10200 [Clostridia bacterium]|nr:hypothetical protein [Clostridia bacterium]